MPIELGWQQRNFTGNACQGPPSTNWTCGTGPTAPPLINGTENRSPTQLFHDGKKNTVSWGVPRPTGNLNGIRDQKVALNYVSGTPFRVGQAQSAPSQHFSATPHAFGSNVAGWNAASTDPSRAMWNMQWFKAGMPGPLSGGADVNLFRAQATFSFRANFPSGYAVVSGFDFSSGQPIYTYATTYTEAIAYCPSSTTQIEVLRARNDN